MKKIVLEPTNQCNRSCRHCFRNKADAPGFLPLKTADAVLSQAGDLGCKTICLTGGEVALYPHLGELLRKIAGLGFEFTLITNGHRFPEQVLPLLLEPKVKGRLASVCFSLDGARAATHDGLRGPKSFREVMEAMNLCRNHRLPLSLKSTVTAGNRGELTELALLGVRMGALEHGFLYPFPTPGFIREGLLPTPQEARDTIRRIQKDLMGITSNRITVDGFSLGGGILDCGHLVDFLNVDYQGHVIFCCTLSHVNVGDGIPTSFCGELVADLKEVSLKEAVVRQFRLAAAVVEARLHGSGNLDGLSETPCLWCLKHFRKLDWLKSFPDSPWTAWLWGGKRPVGGPRSQESSEAAIS
jgi:MoaA/NifB/PqqE/SkfB family radical SAM enzyme